MRGAERPGTGCAEVMDVMETAHDNSSLALHQCGVGVVFASLSVGLKLQLVELVLIKALVRSRDVRADSCAPALDRHRRCCRPGERSSFIAEMRQLQRSIPYFFLLSVRCFSACATTFFPSTAMPFLARTASTNSRAMLRPWPSCSVSPCSSRSASVRGLQVCGRGGVVRRRDDEHNSEGTVGEESRNVM